MEGFADPYRLTQVSIPMGVGFRFALNDFLMIGVEAGVRRTFTDYLDDVSGSYVNYNDLLAGNGELAAALGNRTGELNGSEPVILPTGTQRGNPAEDDWYSVAGVTLSYRFADRNGHRKNRKERELGCPNNF